MKGKRILQIAAAFLLALSVCGQALAAASARPVRVFVYEDTLYTYMKLEDINSPVTQMEAKIGNQSFPASNRLETVKQAGFPITYLLLVDNSNSMPPYREQLVEFGKQLAEASGEKTRFTVATFGDTFQVLKEDVTAQELEKELAAIPCDEKVTRLHSCMDSALDYFETLPRQGAELRAMVAITDAVQYDPTGGVPYEELLNRIQHSDVMVHTLGFGDDSASLDSLGKLAEASDGIHQTLSETVSPKAAAEVLSEAGGSLMVTGFDLSGCSMSGEDIEVSFTLASGESLLCKGSAVADIPEISAEEGKTESLPAKTLPVPVQTTASQSSQADFIPQPKNGFSLAMVGGVTAGIVAVFAAVAVVWFLRKKKKTEE